MLNATAIVGRPSKSNGKKEVGRVVMMLSLCLSSSSDDGHLPYLRVETDQSRGLRHARLESGNTNRKPLLLLLNKNTLLKKERRVNSHLLPSSAMSQSIL